MPRLRFTNVTKSFGDNEVIKGVDAEVPDQEFLVLLGPSGCGKSTMLRMIAGLADVTGGEIWFDDTKVNRLEPRQRNVAFVFQSYALYPHLTVRANIAFPLIMDRFRWYHHVPVVNGVMKRLFANSPEVRDRVEQVAEMLELTPYLDRRPKTLSGGQRQRVAVARALVREPSVYLLDEPLSNLDAKLRTQMRAEITALYQRVRKTFVYVTHDQVEAMTMGTRVIVLNEGEVQQYGTPKEIYARPANTFVARFIGSPAMNLVSATVENESVHIQDGGELRLDGAVERPATAGDVTLGVRAEKVAVLPAGATSEPHLRGHVTVVEHLGAESIIGVRFGPSPEAGLLGEAAARDVVFARMPGEVDLAVGQDCAIVLDLTQASWFDPGTGRRLAQTATAEAGVAP